MFTDWTLTDPHYFYARGVLFGVILATTGFSLLNPVIQRCLKTTKRRNK